MERRKLFLIDDEQDLIDIYSTALSPQYDLETFNSPVDAIEVIKQGRIPDVFVSDIKMPQMDGIQFLEWVRSQKIQKPFVVVSGYSEKSHAMKALKLGAVEMIEKPFPLELFKSVVKRAVVISVYQQIQDDLLTKYQFLSKSLIELAKNYEVRFLAAEDELYRLNRLSNLGTDKAHQLLKTTKESVNLEKVVSAAQDNIRALMLLAEEARTLMESQE